MNLPAVPTPHDCIGVPTDVEEQATRLVNSINTVLSNHYRGRGISVCVEPASEDAIKAVKKHYENAGWKITRSRDEGQRMMRFSREK